MIRNDFQPAEVCGVLVPSPQTPVNKLVVNNSIICTVCNAVIDYIKFEISVLRETSKQIKAGIEKLCKLLSPLKAQADEVCNFCCFLLDFE